MTPIEISAVILLFFSQWSIFFGGLCLTPESGRMAHPLDRRNNGPIFRCAKEVHWSEGDKCSQAEENVSDDEGKVGGK